jgi:hypothetical protein
MQCIARDRPDRPVQICEILSGGASGQYRPSNRSRQPATAPVPVTLPRHDPEDAPMKRVNEFVKVTVVGGALYLIPIVVLLFLIGKAHSVMSRIVAPLAETLELHDIAGINAARLLAVVALARPIRSPARSMC